MIVISIMVILMGIAVPLYQQSLIRARESVLREDLYTLRNAIDQYTLDKQRAPQTLADVAQAGYVKSIPRDPFTNSHDTWTTEMEDSMRSLDQKQPGIADVHSGSDGPAATAPLTIPGDVLPPQHGKPAEIALSPFASPHLPWLTYQTDSFRRQRRNMPIETKCLAAAIRPSRRRVEPKSAANRGSRRRRCEC